MLPKIRRRTTRRGGNRCKDISACFESVSSLYLGLSSVTHHSIKIITLIIIFHIVATNSKICHQTIIKYHSSEESSSMPRDLRPWQSIIRDFSYFGYVYISLLNEPLGNIGLFIIFIFIQSLSLFPLYLYPIFILTASLSLFHLYLYLDCLFIFIVGIFFLLYQCFKIPDLVRVFSYFGCRVYILLFNDIHLHSAHSDFHQAFIKKEHTIRNEPLQNDCNPHETNWGISPVRICCKKFIQ